MSLSERDICIRDFLAARVGALTYNGPLPCNPRYDPGYSIRSSTYHRGTFTVGVNGVGFVAVDAYKMLSTPAAQPPTFNIYKSDSNYAGADWTPNTAPGFGVDKLVSPFLFDTSFGFDSKLVASQVVVRPIGKLVDQAGLIWRVVVPENIRVTTVPASQIFSNPECHTTPVRCGETYITAFTPRNSVLDDTYQAPGITGGFDGFANMGFFVSAGTPGFSFEYEYRAFFEHNPSNSGNTIGLSGATYSPVDARGASIVDTIVSAVASIPQSITASGWFSAFRARAPEYLAQAVVSGAATMMGLNQPARLSRVPRGYVTEL